MKTRRYSIVALIFVGYTILGMSDPAREFAKKMDAAPPEQRVPNWDRVKMLMARVAPEVGDAAPDFSLKTLDGKETIRLSQFQGKQPVVLIFGSYT